MFEQLTPLTPSLRLTLRDATTTDIWNTGYLTTPNYFLIGWRFVGSKVIQPPEIYGLLVEDDRATGRGSTIST